MVHPSGRQRENFVLSLSCAGHSSEKLPLGAEASPAGPFAARSTRGWMGLPQRTGRFLLDATGLYTRFAPRLVS